MVEEVVANLRESGRCLGKTSKFFFRFKSCSPPRRKRSDRPRVHSANGCVMRRPAVARAAPIGRRLERTAILQRSPANTTAT